jgi:hypothetical protein
MAGAFSQAQKDLGVRLTALAKSHQEPNLGQMMTRLGKAGEGDARKAANADLGGDNKFSGWARAPLDTESKYLGDGQMYVGPTKKGGGPWTVAQSGRNSNGIMGLKTNRSGQLVRRGGTRVRKKDGVRVDKWRRTTWNGTTAGKGTAFDAQAITKRETPKRLRKESLKVVTTAFKGGR